MGIQIPLLVIDRRTSLGHVYIVLEPVVVRLHDPTDPSTERTTPPSSAHIQLDDVPRTLDPAEGRGRVPSARGLGDGDGDVICAGRRRSTTML